MKKWLKYLGYALLAFTVLGIIAVATDDSKAESRVPETKPVDIPFSITKKDIAGDLATYHVTINDRTDKASVIELARKVRAESGWKEIFVCYFDIKGVSISATWASCRYLTDWNGTDYERDSNDDKVAFDLHGMSKVFADSLLRLNLDTIANKRLAATYLEDAWKCKTQLYFVDNNTSKLLMAQLSNAGGHYLQWLTLKPTNGENRYYYEEEENYLLLDEAGKKVRFINADGKEWQSYEL